MIKIVLFVMGVMIAQVLVALLIARLIRAGKGPRIVETATGAMKQPQTVAATRSTRAAIDSYSDLSALLIALDPQPERAAARGEREETQEAAPAVARATNQLGPWPGASGE